MTVSEVCCLVFFFFKQKTAYEMRISDWSSDVCSSDRYERCNPLERRSHRSRRVRRPGKAGVGACETGGDPARTRRAGALSARRRGDRRDPAQWRNEARLSWHPELCRSEEHTSELQSIMRNSYAVFFLQKKKN